MSKKHTKNNDDDGVRELALLMAVNCVRNTIIEDCHAAGQLSEAEMMAFNKEVVNKIYTFMRLGMFNPDGNKQAKFIAAQGLMYPHGWDTPEIDDELQGVYDMVNAKGFNSTGILAKFFAKTK